MSTIVTCAITGNLTHPEDCEALPVTPEQIASSALEAADAGAAIAHIHVREPDGTPSMRLELYREVMERIRARNDALILNLTTGPGGRYHPSEDDPARPGPRTNLLMPERRLEHVVALRPDICTLDLNTMTFGREVVINVPWSVRGMAEIIGGAGVRPEVELFDTGDIHLMRDLIAEGALPAAPLCSLVMGVRYGFPAEPRMLAHAASMLPQGAVWTGFGVGRASFPMAAQSWLLGGQVRVGFEDTTFVARGEKAASNAQMVDKARHLIEALGGAVASAEEARERLGLAGTRSRAAAE